MARGETSGLIYVGTGSADAELLARSLGADHTATCPGTPAAVPWRWDWADELDAWRREVAALPQAERVVVCTWPAPAARVPLVEVEDAQWLQTVEWPTALWFTTLVAAAATCRDEGSVVAVVDRPATLDAIGQAPVVAVADGMLNLVRSLAAHEGGRGVRVNAVVTSLNTDVSALPGAAPPLASFPGRVDVEVAGAVRTLLSTDALGMTGIALPVTCGRR